MNYLAQSFQQEFYGSGSPFGGSNPLTSIGSLVSLFLNVAYVIAGVILLFFFIMGGIGLMSSAGQNDPQKLEQAKKTLTSALIGLVIVFASYFIVQFIASLLGLKGATIFGGLFGIGQ